MTAKSRRPPLGPIPAWTLDSACSRPGVDRAWFHPEAGGNGRVAVAEAKRVCASCSIALSTCREYGDTVSPEFGVFGGMTALERKALRREVAV